jgi:hypothetical protein
MKKCLEISLFALLVLASAMGLKSTLTHGAMLAVVGAPVPEVVGAPVPEVVGAPVPEVVGAPVPEAR